MATGDAQGNEVAVSVSHDKTLALWDIEVGCTHLIDHDSPPMALTQSALLFKGGKEAGAGVR